MSNDLTSKLLLIAKVKRPHGLKGEVKLQHFCQDWQSLKQYKTLVCSDDQRLHLQKIRRGRNDSEVIASFQEITNRTLSDALIGLEISVFDTVFPRLKDEEFYHHELIGVRAFDLSGILLGHIQAVHNFGAGDLLEIQTNKGKDFLHPFKPEFVHDIDIEEKKCILTHIMNPNDE